jgi:hypothetical protein
MQTYGVFEIPADAIATLIEALGVEDGPAGFRAELAAWLALRRRDVPISILGV